jgi:hypothetical protein
LFYAYQLYKKDIPEELRLPEGIFDNMLKAYQERKRGHHMLQIVQDCLKELYPDSTKYSFLQEGWAHAHLKDE